MPKRSPYPRLRKHVRKGRAQQVWVSYWYDNRPEGKPDIPLGNDYAEALKKWDELFNRKPRIKGTLQEAFDRWRAEKLPAYNPETRRVYTQQLRTVEKVFGPATWSGVEFTDLCAYLDKRSAKTQANRELAVLSIVWNQARKWGLTKLPWPAHGMERTSWKNPEKPRQFEVTDALFAAVYAQADSTLRDAMDLATATGMRLTDVRLAPLPPGDTLKVRASKTGKMLAFEIAQSPVLSAIVSRRRAVNASHLMLLSTASGRPVSATMLRARWDQARAKAAAKPENAALRDDLKRMYLRDMRKRASDLAGSLEDAQKLLQHDDARLTREHYRSRVETLKPAR